MLFIYLHNPTKPVLLMKVIYSDIIINRKDSLHGFFAISVIDDGHLLFSISFTEMSPFKYYNEDTT